MSVFRGGYEGARVAGQPLISSILESLRVIGQMLVDGAVTTTKLADGSVTTAKIAALAVTTAKLAANAATLAKLGADIYGAAGYPVDIAATESDGVLTTLPRADHRHKHPNDLHPITLGPWSRTNLAAGLTNDDLELDAAGFLVTPYAGRIHAISVRASGSRTGGSADFSPTINGAEQAVSAVLDANNPQNHFQTTAPIGFAAGDRLGAEVTTTAAWAPTTLEITVFVWVTFDLI